LATGSERYLRTNSGLTLRSIGCTENPIIAASPSHDISVGIFRLVRRTRLLPNKCRKKNRRG
jgi:hypothetical protein